MSSLTRLSLEYALYVMLWKFTLNLRLVHHKVLVVPAALELFPVAAVEAQALVLQLVKGEERSREAAVTSISGQDGQRFLLKYSSRYTLTLTGAHDVQCMSRHTFTHPLRAHVHALVHGHVLNDRAEGKRQSDIVWPPETPFENGAAV